MNLLHRNTRTHTHAERGWSSGLCSRMLESPKNTHELRDRHNGMLCWECFCPLCFRRGSSSVNSIKAVRSVCVALRVCACVRGWLCLYHWSCLNSSREHRKVRCPLHPLCKSFLYSPCLPRFLSSLRESWHLEGVSWSKLLRNLLLLQRIVELRGWCWLH